MSDLTPGQWRSVVDASIYLPQEGARKVGRYIAIAELQNIIRKSRRSDSQNRTLWMVYQQILDRGGEAMAGYTREELHDFFLISHFGSETRELFGMKKLRPLRRSSRLTKTEFADFLDFIVRFMAERGVVLDMPEDQRSAA